MRDAAHFCVCRAKEKPARGALAFNLRVVARKGKPPAVAFPLFISEKGAHPQQATRGVGSGGFHADQSGPEKMAPFVYLGAPPALPQLGDRNERASAGPRHAPPRYPAHLSEHNFGGTGVTPADGLPVGKMRTRSAREGRIRYAQGR